MKLVSKICLGNMGKNGNSKEAPATLNIFPNVEPVLMKIYFMTASVIITQKNSEMGKGPTSKRPTMPINKIQQEKFSLIPEEFTGGKIKFLKETFTFCFHFSSVSQ